MRLRQTVAGTAVSKKGLSQGGRASEAACVIVGLLAGQLTA